MTIRLRPGVLYGYCVGQDISRDELARRMGIASTTAWRVDQGLVEPSPKFIAAFIRETGRKFEDLFVIEVAA